MLAIAESDSVLVKNLKSAILK